MAKLRSVTNSAKGSVSGASVVTPLVSANSSILHGTSLLYDEILSDNRTIPEGTEDELSLNLQSRTATFAELVGNLRKSSSANLTKISTAPTSQRVLSPTKNYLQSKKFTSIRQKPTNLTKRSEIGFFSSNSDLKNQPSTFGQTSMSALGMFRSVRRHKPCQFVNIFKTDDENRTVEMPEITPHHRRSKSLTRKYLFKLNLK